MDGSTRVLAVLGDPISQVRSPGVWSALFQHNGVNAACVPFHVQPSDLEAVFGGLRAARNIQGLIVTIPHKPAMLRLVDEATPRARQVGAVNVVAFDAQRRTCGDSLDGAGLVESLHARGQRIRGRRALVVGAGGVGSAIAFAVASAGVSEVLVSDIAEQRAEQLGARLRDAGYGAQVGAPDPRGFDLVINATPLGMRASDPLPVDATCLESKAIVADVVIQPELTPILAAARARGCFVHPGVLMSDAQVVMMASFFGFGEGDWTAETIDQLVPSRPGPAGARCG
jgi:shikimate dehydrogenase